MCNVNGVLCIPATQTHTEVLGALKLGCMLLKLFAPPANADVGINLKALGEFLGCFPRQAEFMVTAGANFGNVEQYWRAGFLVVPSLVSSDLVRDRNWEEITRRARLYMEIRRSISDPS